MPFAAVQYLFFISTTLRQRELQVNTLTISAEIAKSRPTPNTGSSPRYPDDAQLQANVERPSNRYLVEVCRELPK